MVDVVVNLIIFVEVVKPVAVSIGMNDVVPSTCTLSVLVLNPAVPRTLTTLVDVIVVEGSMTVRVVVVGSGVGKSKHLQPADAPTSP